MTLKRFGDFGNIVYSIYEKWTESNLALLLVRDNEL